MQELHNRIVDFLKALPNLHNEDERRALIYSATLDKELEDLVEFDGAAATFCQTLVHTLVSYGELRDGRDALDAVLQAAQQRVGREKQHVCEMLRDELRRLPAEQRRQLKQSPKAFPFWLKVAIPVLVACLILIGVSRMLRIAATHLALDVTAGNVMLTLSKDWTCQPEFPIESMFLDNLAAIEASGVNLTRASATDDNLGWIELQGSGILRTEFTIKAGAEIEVSARNHDIQLFVKRSAITGTVQVQQATLAMSSGEEQAIQAEPPETIALTTSETVVDPIRLVLVTPDAWRLRGLHIQRLGFMEEDPPGSARFVSVIQSGTITLRESGVTRELREAEYLKLEQPRSQQFELASAANGVHVRFEGVAAKILIGSPDDPQDITPTYFEAIIH